MARGTLSNACAGHADAGKPRSAIVEDMTLRGFLRGLRIYLRGFQLPLHVAFGLMFGAVAAAFGGRFISGFMLGVIFSPCWGYAMRKGWIRAR